MAGEAYDFSICGITFMTYQYRSITLPTADSSQRGTGPSVLLRTHLKDNAVLLSWASYS